MWIAAEQIGNAAGYVNATQYGAMLVVGLLGASAFDRWRADRAMIGAKYASAVLALLPVIGFYIWGISIPLLIAVGDGPRGAAHGLHAGAAVGRAGAGARTATPCRRSTACSTPRGGSPA